MCGIYIYRLLQKGIRLIDMHGNESKKEHYDRYSSEQYQKFGQSKNEILIVDNLRIIMNKNIIKEELIEQNKNKLKEYNEILKEFNDQLDHLDKTKIEKISYIDPIDIFGFCFSEKNNKIIEKFTGKHTVDRIIKILKEHNQENNSNIFVLETGGAIVQVVSEEDNVLLDKEITTTFFHEVHLHTKEKNGTWHKHRLSGESDKSKLYEIEYHDGYKNNILSRMNGLIGSVYDID
jgi:hypothetical protein